MSTSQGETVLLLGATGATGKHVLRELLANNHFTRVVEAGRRVTPSEAVEALAGKEKLIQKTIDFDNLQASQLADEKADVVVIVLGTTRAKAGSAEAFIKIDKEYVVESAKAAKTGSDQRLVYLSSQGANASAPSFLLYPKSKGETEHALASLNYKDFIVFRPGYLQDAQRGETRLVESIYGKTLSMLPFGRDSMSISVPTLATSIVKAAQVGSSGLPPTAAALLETPAGIPPYHIIFNKGAIDYAKSS